MFRSRSTLARHKLDEFVAFCESQGWKRHPSKGMYEVLRMHNPNRPEPLIVHQRLGLDSQHLTTWGESERMVHLYLKNRKNKDKSP